MSPEFTSKTRTCHVIQAGINSHFCVLGAVQGQQLELELLPLLINIKHFPCKMLHFLFGISPVSHHSASERCLESPGTLLKGDSVVVKGVQRALLIHFPQTRRVWEEKTRFCPLIRTLVWPSVPPKLIFAGELPDKCLAYRWRLATKTHFRIQTYRKQEQRNKDIHLRVKRGPGMSIWKAHGEHIDERGIFSFTVSLGLQLFLTVFWILSRRKSFFFSFLF